MEEQGLNKVELAERADISFSFFSDLTHGKANPSFRIMTSIEDALGMPLQYMPEETDLTPAEVAELNNIQEAPSKPTKRLRVGVGSAVGVPDVSSAAVGRNRPTPTAINQGMKKPALGGLHKTIFDIQNSFKNFQSQVNGGPFQPGPAVCLS